MSSEGLIKTTIMKNFKHLLFLSILCLPLAFTNCGEDEEQETTPITTGLSENQDLLIGSWQMTEEDGQSFSDPICFGEVLCDSQHNIYL